MILLPEKYNEVEISKDEKLLVNIMKNKLDNTNMLLLKVKPIREAINNVLVFETGTCFFESIEIENIQILGEIIMIYLMQHELKINKIKNKLLTHRLFYGENKCLNIKVTYKYYLTKITKNEIINSSISEISKKFIDENFIFKEDIIKKFKNSDDIKKCMLGESAEYEKIDDKSERLNTLVHMIAPEYTIPIYNEGIRNESPLETYKKNRKNNLDYSINKEQLDVKVFRLDSEQINIVNSIKPGHKLMLACAGSGKSVLLISKCFKIASMHEDSDPKKNKRFLLTCFNKNLNEMYNWRINTAGFRERNVDCFTFHKLCKELLNEINVSYDKNDLDQIFELARIKLNNGSIKRRYYGIFIDEVQVFKPEWYEFCYDLLENKDNEDYFFVVCGDKSQDVANNMKKGKASWQGNDRLPNFRGNSIRLEKNYRNSIQINSFINRFTEISKKNAEECGIQLREDKDYILRGTAIREGNEPMIINTDRFNEAEDIVKVIEDLNVNKGIELYDIAVLFAQRGYLNKRYNIYNWVKDKLNERYIEYSELSPSAEENRTSYAYREGVTLCTINSALGLDFKAVIICGLFPMGVHLKSNTRKSLINADEEVINDFIKNINTIYTGCTRARDELAIIISEKEEKSIYCKMILEASRN